MLECRDLGKRFIEGGKKKEALSSFSFVFPTNGLIGIEGPSGSGKSTLLNLLSLQLKPTEGAIILDGKDIGKLTRKEKERFRLSKLGFVYQDFCLLDKRSVIENVSMPLLIQGLGKKEAEARAESLLQRFSLLDIKEQKAHLLSGGEKQRVAIARALARNPKIILADEPTGSLDEENGRGVMNALKELSLSSLVIVVSHNERSLLEYADEILYIKEGKLVDDKKLRILEKGTSKEGKTKEGNKRRNLSWWPKILEDHFEEDASKIAIGVLSFFVVSSSFLLSIGYMNGSEILSKKMASSSLETFAFGVSKKEKFEIEGSPLSLSKLSRPPLQEVEKEMGGISSYSIKNDYSYFFPPSLPFSFDGLSTKEAEFTPIMEDSLLSLGPSLLKEGRLPQSLDSSSCLVNTEFIDALEGKEAIGHYVETETSITIEDKGFSDNVISHHRFEIKGVVKEFSFLNGPRVYYGYRALEDEMKIPLPNISEGLGKEISPKLLLDEAKGDEAFSSYSYRVFLSSMEDVSLLSSKKDSALSFSSSFASRSESFSLLSKALSDSLLPFLLLELVASFFLVGQLALSSFISKKRETAILSSLGASKSELLSIFVSENALIAILGCLISFLAILVLEKPINRMLEYFSGLFPLVEVPYLSFLGYPFLLPLLILLSILLLVIVSAYLSLRLSFGEELAKELKKE